MEEKPYTCFQEVSQDKCFKAGMYEIAIFVG